MTEEDFFDYVRERLDYNSETGLLTWNNGRYKGKRAGSLHKKKGYRFIELLSQTFKEHRIIWLWYYGSWPKPESDHINRNREDNRIKNLREASSSQNKHNRGTLRTNSNGYPGVRWHKGARKWESSISIEGKRHYLGYFNDPKEAHAAYLAAKPE